MSKTARAVSQLSCLAALALASCLGTALAQQSSDAAQRLRTQRSALDAQLQHNAFKSPLVLVSTETPQGLRGDMYALMDFPFATISSALQDPQQWCEVLILHLNTKYCHVVDGAQASLLNVNIGSKTPQTLSQSSRVALAYTVSATQTDYFEVQLNAPDGPMGTSDYHIALEAVALPANQTFLHLTYAYSANLAARMAMQVYLGTVGSDKVGFTVLGELPDGQPIWIDGVRAVVERNTMRYYLAINSYLVTRQQPPAKRFEASLQNWFSASERFPQQLHEVERPAYLEMKRAEHLRQQTAQ
ncbi:hypothetical protein [Rhodoferax antarcticus]|uniref:Putative signal peptide protein n=1 Tax=Rhodoferax antarcticus ANT.BR TaxID=1111071 RepID=A0A1Q8YA83_9BURK|nr:hypothetical protein [Rhodoferax antarcticus]OLP04877.1 putative signal peptide protein [Rhodoferax antarcticus ANT.BR]